MSITKPPKVSRSVCPLPSSPCRRHGQRPSTSTHERRTPRSTEAGSDGSGCRAEPRCQVPGDAWPAADADPAADARLPSASAKAALRRGGTDCIFSYWSALGWTILTLGTYRFYVFYSSTAGCVITTHAGSNSWTRRPPWRGEQAGRQGLQVSCWTNAPIASRTLASCPETSGRRFGCLQAWLRGCGLRPGPRNGMARRWCRLWR